MVSSQSGFVSSLVKGYLNHKGLLLNLVSIGIFFLFRLSLKDGKTFDLEGAPIIALLFIVVYLAEPWATYYSMGAFNTRREEAAVAPIFLHRSISGILGWIFWGGRVALFGTMLIMSLKAIFAEQGGGEPPVLMKILQVLFFLFIFAREAFIVYQIASKSPNPDYKESLDFLADIVLVIVLAFGELLVKEIFIEVGLTNFNNFKEGWIIIVPILLFFLLFYLPVRSIFTIEDFTFTHRIREKLERLASFILVFLGLLMAP